MIPQRISWFPWCGLIHFLDFSLRRGSVNVVQKNIFLPCEFESSSTDFINLLISINLINSGVSGNVYLAIFKVLRLI